MSRKNSIVILPVVLAILALFSCYGCGTIAGAPDATATPGGTSTQSILSEQQALQILTDSMTDYQIMSTYKFNMTMDFLVEAVVEDEAGTITMDTTISGAMNTIENLVQMTMEMIINTDVPGEPSASQEFTYEIYMLSEYIYMKIVILQGEQWVKVPTTEAIKAQLDLDSVDAQMGILENPMTVECLRIENIGGVECYVLSVNPNTSEMSQWFDEINSSLDDLGVQGTADYTNTVKSFSYLCYVAVDSNRLMKMTNTAALEYSSEQLGSFSEADSMTISYELVMNLYDHNVPFTITVPDEAEGAMELSEDIFLN